MAIETFPQRSLLLYYGNLVRRLGGATRPLPSEGAVEKLHGDPRNSTETQQSGHAPRSGLEVKNGSSAKDGAPERLRCGTIQEVS